MMEMSGAAAGPTDIQEYFEAADYVQKMIKDDINYALLTLLTMFNINQMDLSEELAPLIHMRYVILKLLKRRINACLETQQKSFSPEELLKAEEILQKIQFK